VTPKSLILYKGDKLASTFYMGTGVFLAVVALLLLIFSPSPGFLFLGYGFSVFSVYMAGKGFFMFYIARQRMAYFKKQLEWTPELAREEIRYTKFRILKKKSGRRVHVYLMFIGAISAVGGLFTAEKGLIMGTAIPIVLLSGIEFSVGLLTEFRLKEYLRILQKPIEN
jgi:hypothetical protein